ncbi:MAG: universal stress protein [Youngiibacter sp.]|nr:universal stress protein [Youngiibacter sp.]
MFKKILVATDGSEYSRHALAAALEIAKQFGSEVELIHVIMRHPNMIASEVTVGIDMTSMEYEALSKTVLEDTMKGIEAGGVKIETKIMHGYPSKVVIEEANKGADLIVMGTKGHGPWAGAIMGSVTQRVVSNAPCPVLVVK